MTLPQASQRLREIREESAENERFYNRGIKTYSEYSDTFQRLSNEARELQKIVADAYGGPPVRRHIPTTPKSRYSKLTDTIFDTVQQMIDEGVFTFLYRLAVLGMLGYIIDKL